MNRYRFVITANGFELAVRFSEKEDKGLDWCKRYMGRFQRQVANLKLKVEIFEREMPERIVLWDRHIYKKIPYVYKRTLFKNPISIDGGKSV